MSEEISELHQHGFYGFEAEILDMAKTKNPVKPQKRASDNTSRELVIREDPEERSSQPLPMGVTEEEANLGPVPSGTPYSAEEFESAVILSKLRHLGALRKIISHYGIDTTEVLVRLARSEERSGDGCHDLGAWSASHLEAGAALPLHAYYADFLAYVGIAPFQLIPNGYRVLAGLFVLYKMQGWPTPSPAEILYFYSFRQVPKKEGRDGFYTLMKYTQPGMKYKAPCGNDNHARDYKDKFFFASGFPTETHPTLLLEFSRVGKYPLFSLRTFLFVTLSLS